MKEEIIKLAKLYGINNIEILECIDSSRGSEDIRLNHIFMDEITGKKYVIKMNNSNVITEDFIKNIALVSGRYREIGVWTPEIKKSVNNRYVEMLSYEGIEYKCYIEEYAIYSSVENFDEDFALEVYEHLGRLAAEYSNVDLMEQPSMWTIIQLHPLDVDIDEKQDNLNNLCNSLKEKGYEALANKLQLENVGCRQKIEKVFGELPRCVYQGDLNLGNLLKTADGHFAGLIDFNMAGTEVNINCFLNETMYQLEDKDFEDLSAREIYEKMLEIQDKRMKVILENYQLNDIERECFDAYKKIIYMSLYPNVMCIKYFLDKGMYVEKIVELLERIYAIVIWRKI